MKPMTDWKILFKKTRIKRKLRGCNRKKILRFNSEKRLVFVNFISEHGYFINELIKRQQLFPFDTYSLIPHRGRCEEREYISLVNYGIGQAVYRFYGKKLKQDVRFFINLDQLKNIQERVTEHCFRFSKKWGDVNDYITN